MTLLKTTIPISGSIGPCCFNASNPPTSRTITAARAFHGPITGDPSGPRPHYPSLRSQWINISINPLKYELWIWHKVRLLEWWKNRGQNIKRGRYCPDPIPYHMFIALNMPRVLNGLSILEVPPTEICCHSRYYAHFTWADDHTLLFNFADNPLQPDTLLFGAISPMHSPTHFSYRILTRFHIVGPQTGLYPYSIPEPHSHGSWVTIRQRMWSTRLFQSPPAWQMTLWP